MGDGFVRAYGGQRFASYTPQPPMGDDREDEEGDEDDAVNLEYEVRRDHWAPMNLCVPDRWRPNEWDLCPVRFIDGSDFGETVTSLTSPGDRFPVPVRLSQIGAVAIRIEDGECRREFEVSERVVSMVASLFPWNEVEGFAAALREIDLRLLVATPLDNEPSYDLEKMRLAAKDRSKDEMGILEEMLLAREPMTPAVVDGRLEPRVGGLDPAKSPVFGVVKKHYRTFLHPIGMQALYQLEPGQRTPAFKLERRDKSGVRLPVVSWYVRLAGGLGTMPNWGLVRVEAAAVWFEGTQKQDWAFIDRLSRTLYEYRCRERSYRRAPVSLHPIVRGEENLRALRLPQGVLAGRFYRFAGL